MYDLSSYSSNYGSSARAVNSMANTTWAIVSLVLAIVGALLVYFLFLSKKNEGKFNGFVGWLYDFLSFKKMFLEALLKITYLAVAIYITLASFSLIGVHFGVFLLTLVLGNLTARVIYEFALILLVICRNTTDIAKNTRKECTENKANTENKE